MLHAPSAVPPRKLAHLAVVLVAVLGSRTVEMVMMQSLIIHGLRASRLAQACGIETEVLLLLSLYIMFAMPSDPDLCIQLSCCLLAPAHTHNHNLL